MFTPWLTWRVLKCNNLRTVVVTSEKEHDHEATQTWERGGKVGRFAPLGS